jgi:hypothetical protein
LNGRLLPVTAAYLNDTIEGEFASADLPPAECPPGILRVR